MYVVASSSPPRPAWTRRAPTGPAVTAIASEIRLDAIATSTLVTKSVADSLVTEGLGVPLGREAAPADQRTRRR